MSRKSFSKVMVNHSWGRWSIYALFFAIPTPVWSYVGTESALFNTFDCSAISNPAKCSSSQFNLGSNSRSLTSVDSNSLSSNSFDLKSIDRPFTLTPNTSFSVSTLENGRTELSFKLYGKELFNFEFFNAGESFVLDRDTAELVGVADNYPENATFTSLYDLSELDIQGCLMAADYWASLLSSGLANDDFKPFKIKVFGGELVESYVLENQSYSDLTSGMWEAFENNKTHAPTSLITSNSALMHYVNLSHPSSLNDTFYPPLNTWLTHEIAHLAGMFSVMSAFISHVYDRQSKPYKDGMIAIYAEDQLVIDHPEILDDPNYFIVGYGGVGGVTFRGQNVSEVLDGAMLGLPINGLENNADEWIIDLSHVELEHSVLSHQYFRNYINFMEAELAMFQDMGYDIDRKAFYGHSVYGDNLVVDNYHEFYARDPSGSFYLDGVPNTTALGIGLHVYGKSNQITQYADLLADGLGGTGIRVDGSDNKLTIAPEVNVEANGAYGTGVLFAYGRNHEFNLAGKVRALGQNGVAARFDFGTSIVSYGTDPKSGDYRGSYIFYYFGDPVSPSDKNTDYSGQALNVDGPLISNFTLSGTLEGSAASIFISENAYVKNIDVLNGAQIRGDIISNWDPAAAFRYQGTEPLLTALNFGKTTSATPFSNTSTFANAAQASLANTLATNNGSTGSPITNSFSANKSYDSSHANSEFNLTLYGGIKGEKSLCLNHYSGQLNILGGVEVYDLTNYARLGLFGMNQDGYTATAAHSMKFTSEGQLQLPLWAQSTKFKFKSPDITLGGSLLLKPQADFYASGQELQVSLDFDGDNQIQGEFTQLLVEDAPGSLDFSLSQVDLTTGSATLHVERNADAYTQFATREDERAVGQALYALSNQSISNQPTAVQDDAFKDLLGSIDFASDKSQALNTLTAQSFDVMALASLKNAQSLNNQLFFNRPSLANLGRYKTLAWDQHKTSPSQKADGPDASDLTSNVINGTDTDAALSSTSSSVSSSTSSSVSSSTSSSVSSSTSSSVSSSTSVYGLDSNVPLALKSTNDLEVQVQYNHIQGSRDGMSSGWESNTTNALINAYRLVEAGVILGGHFVFSDTSTDVEDVHSATMDSQSVQVGVSLTYQPESWGLYAQGAARLGLENSDMTRYLRVGEHFEQHDSDWTAILGSFMLGAGYDFKLMQNEKSLVSAGPFALAQYSFVKRPSVTESAQSSEPYKVQSTLGGAQVGMGGALSVDAQYYDSLPLAVGYQLQAMNRLESGFLNFKLSGAAFYNPLSADSTSSQFVLGGNSFSSDELDNDGDRGFWLFGQLDYVADCGVQLQATLGGELGNDVQSLTAGLSLQFSF